MSNLFDILNGEYCSNDEMTARFMCELLSSKTFYGTETIFLKSFVSDVLKLHMPERELQCADLCLSRNGFKIILPCFTVNIRVENGAMSFSLRYENPHELNQRECISLDDILEWLSCCMSIITENDEIPVMLYKALSKFYDKLQNISESKNTCPEVNSDIGDYLGEKVLRAVKSEVLKFGQEYARNFDDYIRIGKSGYMYARSDKNSMWKLCFVFYNHQIRFMRRGDSQLGINAAKESIDEIKEYLTGADLLFVVAGMGRGTGKGAGCVIAEIARDMGILTIGIVTKPFMFEIGVRWPEVKEGIYTIRHNVDAVLIIKNDMVVASFEEKRPLTLAEVYSKIYEVVTQAVKCVTDIIRNSNFADMKNILINADRVITGFGEGEGEDGIKKALLNAIESPFMTLPVQVAAGVLVSITTNGKGLNT